MLAFEIIAEQRIREAIERGEFDRLPGAGQPLRLDDDAMVPPELRVAYKILKNAGCLPPELELRKEIVTLRALLRAVGDDGERRATIRELNRKLLKLSLMSGRTVDLDGFPEYRDRIAARLMR
ncbi:MAG: DnaJ family domain-containing protein [Gemmatimonadota bacterium]